MRRQFYSSSTPLRRCPPTIRILLTYGYETCQILNCCDKRPIRLRDKLQFRTKEHLKMANSNPLKIALAIYHLPLLVQVNFPKSYYEPSIMSTSYTQCTLCSLCVHFPMRNSCKTLEFCKSILCQPSLKRLQSLHFLTLFSRWKLKVSSVSLPQQSCTSFYELRTSDYGKSPIFDV